MPPSCAYVIVRPLGPSISAGLSPNVAACSSTKDGSDVGWDFDLGQDAAEDHRSAR